MVLKCLSPHLLLNRGDQQTGWKPWLETTGALELSSPRDLRLAWKTAK